MHSDLSSLLDSWRHAGGHGVQARLINGRDGEAKVQLRLELGILQMELHGRPDGSRPHGHESLLDYHLAEARRISRLSPEERYQLDHEACAELHRESLQYYHRRISLLELGMYELAEQDANHNLQALDLLREHAERREDWLASEQYRAFIMSHRAMARALAHAYDGRLNAALRAVDEGMEAIQQVLRESGRGDHVEHSSELEFLKALKARIRRGKPGELRERLEQELQIAVEREEYERAAELRDRLQNMP